MLKKEKDVKSKATKPYDTDALFDYDGIDRILEDTCNGFGLYRED